MLSGALPPLPLFMSTTRPRVKLDEQSFQGLLAAAFTIQEHNDKQKRVLAASSEPLPAIRKFLQTLCPYCAAPLQQGETRCPQCGSDEFRPGERMQRKFASLWEMSQEQTVRHEPGDRPGSALDGAGLAAPDSALPANDEIRIVDVPEESPARGTDWFSRFPELAYLQQDPASDLEGAESVGEATSGSVFEQLRQWWRALNLPRADLYLGIAILVALLAIVWPAPVTPQKGRLQPWQRVLVKMGIAEAPPASIHYRGDPNVQVWVDPHTALYYCPGEEQYGKSANGRFTAQREAQLEQFEPAGRAVCQ